MRNKDRERAREIRTERARERPRHRARKVGDGKRVSLGYRLWECHRKRLQLLRVGESESEREIARE